MIVRVTRKITGVVVNFVALVDSIGTPQPCLKMSHSEFKRQFGHRLKMNSTKDFEIKAFNVEKSNG